MRASAVNPLNPRPQLPLPLSMLFPHDALLLQPVVPRYNLTACNLDGRRIQEAQVNSHLLSNFEGLLIRSRFVEVETVALIVGPERLHVTVHKDLLCKETAYFKKVFASGFKEGEDKTISMPEDDPDIVDIFLKWLYGDEQATTFMAMFDSIDMCGADFDDKDFLEVLELFFFADKYGVKRLNDHLIDCFYNCSINTFYHPTIEQYKMVFEKTPAQSGLRRLFIDWGIQVEGLNWLQDARTREWMKGDLDIAVDFIIAMSKRIKSLDKIKSKSLSISPMCRVSDYIDQPDTATQVHPDPGDMEAFDM